MSDGHARRNWLDQQAWERDYDHPVISLGEPGSFDDMHVLSPCVELQDNVYRMWYCGSRSEVSTRAFHLGLATSADGRAFQKWGDGPVLIFGENRSILTPTFLRTGPGHVLRENGRLRMWFASANFPAGGEIHTLHETTSEDGINWSTPSEAQLHGLYAPTVLFDQGRYRMWFVDVTVNPWVIRYAESDNGSAWRVHPDPVIVIDQPWERQRLFYPVVVRDGDTLVMWYGSYSNPSGTPLKTAMGCAVSTDGIHWTKSEHNPVIRPEPSRPWESHFATSGAVMQLPDGRWRFWFATREKPPHIHKYFAISTAVLA